MASPPPSKLGRYSPEEFKRMLADKKHIKPLPEEAVSQGIDFVLENYPFHDVTIEQFKALVSTPNSSLKLRRDIAIKYNLGRTKDPLDHWVAESLKIFDRELYDSCKGYSKIARVGNAFFTLLKFARPVFDSKMINSMKAWRCAYDEALQYIRSLFKGKKFETLTASDFMRQLPQNTAAGFPFLGKKKGEVWSTVHRKSIDNYFKLTSGKKIENLPYTLALRGHLSPIDENKTRPVWVAPFEHVVLENILFRNVYDFIFRDKEMSELILTGKKTLSRLRAYLNIETMADYVNIDYSAFDSWRCRFVGIDLFKILNEVIDYKPGERNILYFVRTQFLDSKILLPDGTCFQKQSGTPSGSLLTALINSLMNVIFLKTCFKIMEVDHNIEHLRVLGDDAAFFYGDRDLLVSKFLEELSMWLKKLFGLTLKPEKCFLAPGYAPMEQRKFIGYSIHNNQLYRPEEEFWLSVLYPEHEVKNVIVSFSRVFSYYMLGGMYHNKFTQWFTTFLGHYWHRLSKADRLLDEEVFRMGNLRVIKHVFQIEVDEFLTNFDVNKLRSMDMMQLPYFLTMDVPLKRILQMED